MFLFCLIPLKGSDNNKKIYFYGDFRDFPYCFQVFCVFYSGSQNVYNKILDIKNNMN